MVLPLLAYSNPGRVDSLPLHDRVQIALAIADEAHLKSLLTDCIPPIAPSHCIGEVSTTIGIPVGDQRVVDGMVQYESIRCILAASQQEVEQRMSQANSRGRHREFADVTRCEAEARILGQSLNLAQALALLTHVGFTVSQVRDILHLPYDGWHKSWWYTTDREAQFTVPFLRLMRTLRYPDGTYTLQYKDFFAEEKPDCFSSIEQKVMIEIGSERLTFRSTLEKINYTRQQLGLTQAILICDRISPLEAQGFISQGISLYTATEVTLPPPADCIHCANHTCPMQGNAQSPVLTCHQFCLEGEAATED